MILTVWVWAFRHIHVALDTVVLYGVLRERNMDERAAENGGNKRVAEGSNHKSMPALITPPLF